MIRLFGLALVFKRQMISDRHFTAEFMAIKPFRKDQNIAFIAEAKGFSSLAVDD